MHKISHHRLKQPTVQQTKGKAVRAANPPLTKTKNVWSLTWCPNTHPQHEAQTHSHLYLQFTSEWTVQFTAAT